jgi:hypothetical protein
VRQLADCGSLALIATFHKVTDAMYLARVLLFVT